MHDDNNTPPLGRGDPHAAAGAGIAAYVHFLSTRVSIRPLAHYGCDRGVTRARALFGPSAYVRTAVSRPSVELELTDSAPPRFSRLCWRK